MSARCAAIAPQDSPPARAKATCALQPSLSLRPPDKTYKIVILYPLCLHVNQGRGRRRMTRWGAVLRIKNKDPMHMRAGKKSHPSAAGAHAGNRPHAHGHVRVVFGDLCARALADGVAGHRGVASRSLPSLLHCVLFSFRSPPNRLLVLLLLALLSRVRDAVLRVPFVENSSACPPCLVSVRCGALAAWY